MPERGGRRLLAAGAGLAALLVLAALAGPLLLPHHPDAQLDPVAARHLPPGSRGVLVTLADGRTLVGERSEALPGGGIELLRLGQRVRLSPAELASAGDLPSTRAVRFPLGTDRFGRDLAARLLAGARVSLAVGLAAVGVALTLGVAAGSAAALGGPWVDGAVMRTADALLAFPRLFLALAAAAFLGPGLPTAIAILGATGWMGVARLVRAELLSLEGREFALAARASGLPGYRVYLRHLLPNALTPVFVDAALRLGDTILVEASLSFLGLGIQPPQASWGNLIADGRDALGTAWWVAALPGAALVVTVLAFNLLGEGLRDALDPRRRTPC
ncbi:MAG: ABC transporter permease [Thermoanaerobaculia bacterium]|nr:ABC transporter permease [Thermoanaerobaculia bacterium]